MFREMKKKNQLLSEEITNEIMEKHAYGILGLIGDEGYPYTVPLSYVFLGDKILLHGSPVGHKCDAIRNNPKASFCVVDQSQVVPAEFTNYFRSVIAFGKVRILETEDERREVLLKFATKFSPDFMEKAHRLLEKYSNKAVVSILFEIEHITGKESSELVQLRKGE